MIAFVPERGHILICNFDMANVPPEMPKVRRVVVVSPRSYNGTRRCIVVPFSATDERLKDRDMHRIEHGMRHALGLL